MTTRELSAVLEREGPLRLLRAQAQALGCEVGVFEVSGAPMVRSESFPELAPTSVNATLSFTGDAGAIASRPVRVFDHVVGHVVAWCAGSDEGPSAATAKHGAELLGTLCAREYEINDLSREILDAYEELNLFYDLSQTLAGAPDLDTVAGGILALAERVVHCAGCWVLAPHASGGLRVIAERGMPHATGSVLSMDDVRGTALDGAGPELIEDLTHVPSARLGVLDGCVRHSLISVPLRVPGHEDRAPLGMLQLCDKGSPEAGEPVSFTAGDLKLAHALAGQAAALVENSRLIGYERELEIARTIQQKLLPGKHPDVPGLDVAGCCQPASNVGGDYYDHIELPDGRLALLLADVSGHNLAAALMQTAARSGFRAAALTGDSPVAVLDRTNAALYDDLSSAELFLTAWFGLVDPSTGDLEFGGAGHNPAFLYRAATGEVEALDVGGMPIGVLRDGEYAEARTRLEPGDVLLAYTDGLTEACRLGMVREEFGEERLKQALARFSGAPAVEILDRLLGEIAAFSGGGPASDDRTLLVLKLRPAASSS